MGRFISWMSTGLRAQAWIWMRRWWGCGSLLGAGSVLRVRVEGYPLCVYVQARTWGVVMVVIARGYCEELLPVKISSDTFFLPMLD
jgi:hypothetical protein